MTVSVEPIEAIVADPVQSGVYNFTFDWQGGQQLAVRLFRSDGLAELNLSPGADWTATPATRATGGALTLLADPTGYDRLLIRRATIVEQPFDAPPTAAGFEAALDRQAMAVQERLDEFSRAVQAPEGSSNLRLPALTPGKLIGWSPDAAEVALYAPLDAAALNPETGAIAQSMGGTGDTSLATALANDNLLVSVTDPQFAGGAKGDGVFDSTAAFQAAALYAGEVVVPSGGWKLTQKVSGKWRTQREATFVTEEFRADPAPVPFFADDGGSMYREPRRSFFGAAAGINGNANPGTDRTWVGFGAAGLMTYFESRAQNAFTSTNGTIAGSFSSRTSDSDAGEEGACIAVAAHVDNDSTTDEPAWSFYATAFRSSADAGYTHGAEVNVTNYGNEVPVSAHDLTATGLTAGLWVRTGGEPAAAGQTIARASVGIAVVGSSDSASAQWLSGLVFQNTAIAQNAFGRFQAIEMPSLHTVAWTASDGAGGAVRAGEIRSDGTAAAADQAIIFQDARIMFSTRGGGAERSCFAVRAVNDSVNLLEAVGGATGEDAVLEAIGADANVGIEIRTKGTGKLKIPSAYTAGAPAATGYVTLVSATGQLLEIPARLVP